MPVYRLDDRLLLPPPERGPRRGPIAVGGDLRPERLLLAYSMGIFPWQGEPLHWHSPDPRMVLLADELKVSRSLRRTVKRRAFRLTLDAAFTEVMVACAQAPRPGQEGTWITPGMVESYTEKPERLTLSAKPTSYCGSWQKQDIASSVQQDITLISESQVHRSHCVGAK